MHEHNDTGPMIIGTVEHVSKFPSASELAKAKERVLESIFETVREIANNYEDFFIIKTIGTDTTVGTKIALLTVVLEDE